MPVSKMSLKMREHRTRIPAQIGVKISVGSGAGAPFGAGVPDDPHSRARQASPAIHVRVEELRSDACKS